MFLLRVGVNPLNDVNDVGWLKTVSYTEYPRLVIMHTPLISDSTTACIARQYFNALSVISFARRDTIGYFVYMFT